jgi:hypothetical protein
VGADVDESGAEESRRNSFVGQDTENDVEEEVLEGKGKEQGSGRVH